MDKRHHRSPRRITLFFLAALAACAFCFWSNTSLQITQTEARFDSLPAGFDGCRIAVLSDLHGKHFGEQNRTLLEAVAAEQPEYILVAGDLIDEKTPDPQAYAAELAAPLRRIAPVFYVTGNHEWAAGGTPALKQTLSDAGWEVLSNRHLMLERNGSAAVLAGIDDPNGYADQKTPEETAAALYADCGDPFWILLAHRNDRFAPQYSLLGADLVISGHGHGGVIRLPFTDGLLGTRHTLFPTHTAGLYRENGSTLFVSRGLGNSAATFRLFNRPEVAMVTLRKGS